MRKGAGEPGERNDMIAGAADFGKTKEAGTWLEVSENK